MPLLRQSLYSQNVNLYLAPTADARDTWLPLMRTVAGEGRCFVLSANQCMARSNLPHWITGENNSDSISTSEEGHSNGHGSFPTRSRRKSTITDDGNEIVLPQAVDEEAVEVVATKSQKDSSEFVSRGGSCIISPMGDVLAGPIWDEEDGLLFVDVDFDDCLRGRLDLDVSGSYSRSVYRSFPASLR
ncbi:hypothetical protein ACMFMG_009369 [Clarireedia jacksonii]